MAGQLRVAVVLVVLVATLAACACKDGCGVVPPSGYPAQSTATRGGGASPAVPGSSAEAVSPAPSGEGTALPARGAWAKVEIDGPTPPAREDHTWTVDPDTGVAFLFGGRADGEAFGDLWAFDLATNAWRDLAPTGKAPAARFGHEAAWLPGRGLVVTLGQAGSGFFDDIWLYDAAAGTWAELPGNGARPVARYGSCSGIGPDDRLWISHGFTEEGTRFSDTRAYDFEAETWSDATPPDLQPVERCLHACWWTDDGDLALYGGQTTGVAALGDLWLLEGAQPGHIGTWTKLDKPGLAARQLPATARRGRVTVVFGGRDIDRDPLDDTWLLPDPGGSAIGRLEIDGASPKPRSGAAMVYDEARDRMLLFGGIGEAARGDAWALSFD